LPKKRAVACVATYIGSSISRAQGRVFSSSALSIGSTRRAGSVGIVRDDRKISKKASRALSLARNIFAHLASKTRNLRSGEPTSSCCHYVFHHRPIISPYGIITCIAHS